MQPIMVIKTVYNTDLSLICIHFRQQHNTFYVWSFLLNICSVISIHLWQIMKIIYLFLLTHCSTLVYGMTYLLDTVFSYTNS